MTKLEALLAGAWEFVAGDDWRTALGVVLALALTAVLASLALTAWWVMPLAVIGLLALSIRRAALPDAGGVPDGARTSAVSNDADRDAEH